MTRVTAWFTFVLGCMVILLSPTGQAQVTFAPGDLFISLETGPVQWRASDGTLYRLLYGSEVAAAEGMAFDAAGNLYVTRWCIDSCLDSNTGNTVEMFSNMGIPMGRFGSAYDCSPHAIHFDRTGAAYVGLSGCSGAIVKLVGGQTVASYPVAPDYQGASWLDLAPDGCTMFYTSWGPNVKRFDVCTGTQLPNFNAAALPGGVTHDVRVLPDGGVIVASGEIIARLDSAGALVQSYSVPGEPSYWAGLDLTADGGFWAANYESSKVHKFDLGSGALRATVDAATPAHTVVAVRVKR